jgi:hypothetical protein
MGNLKQSSEKHHFANKKAEKETKSEIEVEEARKSSF